MKIKLILFLIVLFAVGGFGQRLNYSTRPAGDRAEVVRMHVALSLLSGNWNSVQRDLLLRAVQDPASVSESETVLAFSPREVRDIFYRIGTIDISQYRETYSLSTIADKRRYLISLTAPERADVWRAQFAHAFAAEKLTAAQQDFLIRVSDALRNRRRDQIDALAAESFNLFDRDLGRRIFGTIGPFESVGKFCGDAPAKGRNELLVADCVCSYGGSNWSCYDTCTQGGGSCTTTDAGCGFLWMFKCDGNCRMDPEGT